MRHKGVCFDRRHMLKCQKRDLAHTRNAKLCRECEEHRLEQQHVGLGQAQGGLLSESN
jgi:hypothetical protein